MASLYSLREEEHPSEATKFCLYPQYCRTRKKLAVPTRGLIGTEAGLFWNGHLTHGPVIFVACSNSPSPVQEMMAFVPETNVGFRWAVPVVTERVRYALTTLL